MNTIPNLAPRITPRVLDKDELNFIEDDDFIWVELRHGKEQLPEAPEDETFHLRVGFHNGLFFEFCVPDSIIHCELDDYGYSWRVWNLPAAYDSEEMAEAIWESRRG